MISSKEDAIEFFRTENGKIQINKEDLQVSIEVLQKIALEDGLSEEDIDDIVKFLVGTKINAQARINIFNCLIPETKISNQSLEDVLLWFFTEMGNERISITLGKKCLQWLTGITYYELADVSVLESYYYSFIFLLSIPYLENFASRLLCLISKPEDARRWVVQQILQISSNGSQKPQTNSLLSLLKSYRAYVVPERISPTNFHYKTTPFDDLLKKAHDRKLLADTEAASNCDSNIQWNILSLHDEKSKRLRRLVPSVDSMNTHYQNKHQRKKLRSIYEFKTMASLGVRPFHVECPAETLSLLGSLAGYHVLAFSDVTIKIRFFHKLYHTLFRVYLLELEPYTEKEKIFFLNSIKGLQEYTQQSIPVVTRFLYYYLPVWDGAEFQEQILKLLEWLDINDEEDLRKHIFPSLRQVFISSDTRCKCLIIETMGRLMRNILIMHKKERNCFSSNFQNCNAVKCIEAIGVFVSDLITIGLIWNNEKETRDVLNTAVDFYRTTLAVEQAGDLPIIMIMPPALVYNCLFSNSRVCIEKLCSLLVELYLSSIERLNLLGVFQDFALEVQKLNIYILDYYRCLWSKTNLREDQSSFIFQHNIFRDKIWKLKQIYGDIIDKIFRIEYSASFWNPGEQGSQEKFLDGQIAFFFQRQAKRCLNFTDVEVITDELIFNGRMLLQLVNNYPAVIHLKQKTESHLLAAGFNKKK